MKKVLGLSVLLLFVFALGACNKEEAPELKGVYVEGLTPAYISLVQQDEKHFVDSDDDIIIIIHLSNPDDLEIISITLNKEVYDSSAFEGDSTSTEIKLKVNVGKRNEDITYKVENIQYKVDSEVKEINLNEKNSSVLVPIK